MGVGAENGAVAVEEKGLVKLYEIAPEVSFLVAKPGPGGALRVHAGPRSTGGRRQVGRTPGEWAPAPRWPSGACSAGGGSGRIRVGLR
jgi:hypothetical protein